MASDFPMRLNKYLARAGYATRRSADTLIHDGRVFVNGKLATLGQKVTESDTVEIQDFKKHPFRYILYYKPRGIVTHSPSETETDIQTHILNDHGISNLFPVGRLDKESEGLILLTDDGRVTERILSPEQGHERTYEVTVDKRITQTFLNALSKGVQIENYRTKPAHAQRKGENEHIFTLTLTEGKKHQIRRMCARFGYQVTALKRTEMHTLSLKKLKPGAYYELKPKEIRAFTTSLGLPF